MAANSQQSPGDRRTGKLSGTVYSLTAPPTGSRARLSYLIHQEGDPFIYLNNLYVQQEHQSLNLKPNI